MTKKHYGRWTSDDHKFILKNYKSMSNQQMAAHLGRTPASVSNQRTKLGLNNWDYGTRPEGRNNGLRHPVFNLAKYFDK